MEPKMLINDAAVALNVTAQALHNQIKRKNLKVIKNRNRVYFTHSLAKQLLGLTFSPQIVAVQIVKGGVGKTTLSVNISARAASYGARTLLIDLDQQGNATNACRIKANDKPVLIDLLDKTNNYKITDLIVPVCDGLDLIPSRIENALLDNYLMLKHIPHTVYRDHFQPLKDRYDLIIIDCPPALGYSVTAAALASDRILMPIKPDEYSLQGLKIALTEYDSIKENFKQSDSIVSIVLNEFDSRTSLSRDIFSDLLKDPVYSGKLLKTVVGINQEFKNSQAKGESIFDSLKDNSAKEDIDLLTRELLEIGEFSKEKNQKNKFAFETDDALVKQE
jgi:chromosome partitioning protein